MKWLPAITFWIAFLYLANVDAFSQEKSPKQFFAISPEFNKARFYGVTGGILGIYGGTLGLLSQYWYKDYPKTSFHVFDDRREWLGMDKAGHVFNAYYISRWSTGLYRWTGASDKASIWIGGMMGTFLMSSIEILDGFSSKWGFSGWDFLANMGGSAIVIGQELAWREQRLMIKISAIPQDYPAELESRANELYGNTGLELFLKDYNAITIWASVNVYSFMKKDRRFPEWLNIAFGVGADGLYGGFENKWCQDPSDADYCDCSEANRVDRSDIERYSQFYLSLDVDFTKVETKRAGWKVLLHLLNLVKVPSPTVEFNRIDKVKFHPLFF